MKPLAKAMMTVAGLTGLSRIAGFVRDIMTASFLGAGSLADAFFVALKLPNFFRRVTAEGAFSVAFIPIYSRELALADHDGEKNAAKFAGNAMATMFFGLSFLSILAMIFMPAIITVIAPGFHNDGATNISGDLDLGQLSRFDMAVDLSRVTFPYLLFMSLSALLGGMLNAHNRFAPFAVAPILFNLCLIGAILIGHLSGQDIGFAMAFGISISGALQFLWLVACLRHYKIPIKLGWPKFTPNLRKLFRLMGPGVLGAGVMHVNLFADMIIASLLSAGSISYLYYADRLNQLPLGMVGIALGTALLPMLSKSVAAKKWDDARDLFNRAIEYCLLLALPAALGLLVIPDVIIGALFERGAFTAEDTAKAAQVLQCYAIGLPAYMVVKILSTAHWSQENTKTPVKISIMVTMINIALSLILIYPLGVAGIALSTSLVGWLQVGLLLRSLRGSDILHADATLRRVVPRIILAALSMALVTVITVYGMHEYAGVTMNLLVLLVCLTMAGVTYVGMVFGLKIIDFRQAKRYFRRSKL